MTAKNKRLDCTGALLYLVDMESYEASAVDEASSFGVKYRPTYRTFASGIGAFVSTALSDFKYDTALCVQKLAGASYTVRRVTGADLDTVRAAAEADWTTGGMSTGMARIASTLTTGKKYDWAFTDSASNTFSALAMDVRTLINNLLDASFPPPTTLPSVEPPGVGDNDWLFVDMSAGDIYYGPGTTFSAAVIAAVPNPEVTLAPSAIRWV